MILHATWIPAYNEREEEPGIFLWVEDPMEALDFSIQIGSSNPEANMSDLSLGNQGSDTGNDEIDDPKGENTQPQINRQKDGDIKDHPFVLDPRELSKQLDEINNNELVIKLKELITEISAEYDQHNGRDEKERSTNDTGNKSRSSSEYLNIKFQTRIMPIPTYTGYSPILSAAIRYINEDYWGENEKQLRIIAKQFHLNYKQMDPRYAEKIRLYPSKIKGIKFDLLHSIQLLEVFMALIDQEYEFSKFKLGESLWYWSKLLDLIYRRMRLGYITPSFLPAKQLRSTLHLHDDNIESDDNTYLAWWELDQTFDYQSELNRLTKQIPFSSRLKSIPVNQYTEDEQKEIIDKLSTDATSTVDGNNVHDTDKINKTNKVNEDNKITEPIEVDDEDKSVQTSSNDNTKDTVSTDYSDIFYSTNMIVHDFTELVPNMIIRVLGSQELEPFQSRVNALQETPQQIVKALFSDQLLLTSTSKDKYLLSYQFNQWMSSSYRKSAGSDWTINIQLIPPEEGLSDNWIMTFLFRNGIDRHVIIPITEVLENPSGPITKGQFVLESPFEVFMDQLMQMAEYFSLFKQLINSDNPFFYELEDHELNELLGEVGEKLKESGYDVLLPKSVMKKYVPSSETKIQLNLQVGKSENNLLGYDLSVMIQGQQISLEELQRMVQTKRDIIQIADKWVEFNINDALKIKKMIEKKKNQLGKLEVLKLELGDTELLDEMDLDHIGSDVEFKSNFDELVYAEKLDEEIEIDHFQGKLRPYQKKGVRWMLNLINWNFGGCLADDMGLGKTIQVLAGVQYLKNNKRLNHPVFVIAPTSVISNWVKEAKKFTPQLDVFLHHGSDRPQTTSAIQQLGTYDLVVTSYGTLRQDIDALNDLQWDGIIVDEAQNIKNPGTQQSQAARTLESEFKFALTGTPIENRLADLWSIFHFLLPGYFGSFNTFKDKFIKPIEKHKDDFSLKRLRQISDPFIIRRKKTDHSIIKDLPDKTEQSIYCPMTEDQISLYKATVDETQEKLAQAKNEEGMKRRGLILSTITKLKQICNHPATMLKEEEYSYYESGKLQTLFEHVEPIIEDGEKAIIFTQYRKMGEIIGEFLKDEFDIDSPFLHGGVRRSKREEMIKKFNTDPLENQIFIVSLRAGGTGLNLTAASHVIHFDRWWNPAVEEQATDRAYRIGQTKNVFVYKLITKGTIEERIDDIIEEKKELADQFLSGIKGLTEFDDDELKEIWTLRENIVAE